MIVIEKQGAVVVAYDPDYTPLSPKRPPKRGDVTEFSRKSRRRLMLLMNRMDWSARATFLTLTFHSCPTISQSNTAFKRFRTWMGRAYPGASAIWRREFQPKRGAIHFHLIVFNLPFIPQRFLQEIWTRHTGEDRSIVHVTLLKNRKHGMAYVSKYVAKLPEEESTTSLELSPYQHTREKTSIGRCWGYVNADALPYAPAERFETPDEDLTAYFWVAASALTGGRCGQNEHVCIMFADDASVMYDWMREHCRLVNDLWPGEGKICYNVNSIRLAA